MTEAKKEQKREVFVSPPFYVMGRPHLAEPRTPEYQPGKKGTPRYELQMQFKGEHGTAIYERIRAFVRKYGADRINAEGFIAKANGDLVRPKSPIKTGEMLRKKQEATGAKKMEFLGDTDIVITATSSLRSAPVVVDQNENPYNAGMIAPGDQCDAHMTLDWVENEAFVGVTCYVNIVRLREKRKNNIDPKTAFAGCPIGGKIGNTMADEIPF